ncbi:MAG: hypothetical protein OHK0022_21140 [Roseiflexaceae bacterium]
MHDCVIIGGGPAALSAAVYALGKGLDTLLVFEDLGGQVGVRQRFIGQLSDEYLAGEEAVRMLQRRIIKQSERSLNDRVLGVTAGEGLFLIETQRHGTLSAATLLVATGANPVLLNVPGAKDLLGYGLGYSITTHAHLLKGRRVGVIGATTRALRGVAELARVASQVQLILPATTCPPADLLAQVARLPNVTVLAECEIRAIVGSSAVEHVVVEQEGQAAFVRVDAVFADLGLLPNSAIVRHLVQTDPEGFIVVNGRQATSRPGIFAAGDVSTAPVEQMLIAIGDGARAAASAYDYLLLPQR